MPDINALLARIASAVGATVEELTTEGRTKLLSDQKAIACWILRQYDISLRDIGAYMGVTHAAVRHNTMKVEASPPLLEEAMSILEDMRMARRPPERTAELLREAIRLLSQIRSWRAGRLLWSEIYDEIDAFLNEAKGIK